MSLNTTVPTNINDTYAVPSLPVENISNKEDKANKGIANGYAPLDGTGKVPEGNLPDTASLDAEVNDKINTAMLMGLSTHNSQTTSVHGIADTANLVLTNDARLSDSRTPTSHTHSISDVTGLQNAINNSGIKAGVQWIDRSAGGFDDFYSVGSIVYHNGRVYRSLAVTPSEPIVGGNSDWLDLGVGYLLPSENPKIVRNSINTGPSADSYISVIVLSGSSAYAGTYRTTSTPVFVLEEGGTLPYSLSSGNGKTINYFWGSFFLDSYTITTSVGSGNGIPNFTSITVTGFDGNYVLANGTYTPTHGGENYGNPNGYKINGNVIFNSDFSVTLASSSSNWIDGDMVLGSGTGSPTSTSIENGVRITTTGITYTPYRMGGTINTSDGGGSIDTRGVGSIQLGVTGNRTTLVGSASGSDKTITLPNETGTIALTDHTIKAGVQWTTRHTTFTGNPYVVGSIVYHNGRVYRCIAENDSMPPQEGGTPYWADLGVGYLLPNENPKILGGSIDISAGAVTERSYQVETGDEENPFETENETTQAGGSNGNIILKGGNGGFHLLGGDVGGNAGSINTSGGVGSDGRGGNGGSILLVGGTDTADAGSINLSGAPDVGNGGSIISTGYGNYNGGTLNLSAGVEGHGGSISIQNKGGGLNLSGDGSCSGGSINLRGYDDGNGGTINGSNNGGSIQFSGTRLRAGGSINLNAGNKVGGSVNEGLGGTGGKLELKGAEGGDDQNFANGGNGGTILGNGGSPRYAEEDDGDTYLVDGYNAGTINFSGGSAGVGGSIDTSDGGGSIITNGYGSIQIGDGYRRITLVGATRDLSNPAELGNKTITLPNKSGTIALTSHTHGNITSDGRFVNLGLIAGVTYLSNIDTLANGTYSVIQSGHSGVVSTVVVGGTAGAKTVSPTNSGTGYSLGSATYGSNFPINITSITGSNLPLITSSSGVITTSAFGTTANSFCQGNDTRLSNRTIFTLGGEEKITYAIGQNYFYGGQLTRGSKHGGALDQTGRVILGNWSIAGVTVHQLHPSASSGTFTYSIVTLSGASAFNTIVTAGVLAGNNGLTTEFRSAGTHFGLASANINNGDRLGLMLTVGGTSVPTNLNSIIITAEIYCVPR